MERNGFNTPHFETSGEDPDDSKEKLKNKKKKSPESKQKESFADRFKASLGEKLIADKPEKPEKTEKPDEPERESSPDESVETAETDAEKIVSEITHEEEPEVDERLKEANIAALHAEIAGSDDDAEIAANQAAIEMLENTPASELVIEADDIEPAIQPETLPEHQDDLFSEEAEPLPFEDEADIPLSAPPTSGGGSGTGRFGGSRPSGGMTPPPPTVPPAPVATAGPAFRGPNVQPSMTPNIAPNTQAEYQPDYRVNPNRSYLLVGGVVGYLIGRRRGRIKTEKRMNVVVGKLEKQVEAKQRVIDQHIEATKLKARQEYWSKKSRPGVESARESGNTSKTVNAVETPAIERSRTGSQPERPSETIRAKQETPSPSPERPASNIELSDEDIARISETVTIGATNLKKIHEAKLITDGGLRRLVSEHLQGKDIRRGLAREFLTKELSYERDPRFRDIVPLEAKGKRPPAGGAIPIDAPLPAGAVALAVADSHDLKHIDSNTPQSSKPKRSAVSTGVLSVLSLVALALAVYAVWLGMSR